MSEQSYEGPRTYDPNGIYMCYDCGETFHPFQNGADEYLCALCFFEQERTRVPAKLKDTM